MMIAAGRRGAPKHSAGMLVILSALCFCPLHAYANQLSEIPAAFPTSLSLPDLKGRHRSLSEFEDKIVLVTFWASWCRPCIEEVPSLHRLVTAMTGIPFIVVGVNVGEDQRRVQTTVTRLGIEFPVLLDKDSVTFKGWGADVLPTAYVLDANGRMRYVRQGSAEWDQADIVDTLKHLATEQPPPENKTSINRD